MTLRLSLFVRVAGIVLIIALIAWLSVLWQFYRRAGMGSEAPTPQQVAALVDLMETSPAERRETLTAALSVGSAEVSLIQSRDLSSLRPAGRSLDASAYSRALGDRPVAVQQLAPPYVSSDRLRFLATVAAGHEVRVGLHDGETLVIATRAPVVLNSVGLPVGFFAGLVGTMLALALLIVMHKHATHLTRLMRAIDGLDPMMPPHPLPRPRAAAPEIQRLIDAFNSLQERIALLLRARLAMLGGISHDVRTFATRLRLRVEQIPNPDERERAVADIDDMIQLLDDSLLASRAGAQELNEELVDFSEIVRADAEDRRGGGRLVALAIAPDADGALVLGDRVALRRIVANLTGNAAQYASRTSVMLERANAQLVLTVDDDGPGIPEQRRKDLLEPFVRIEGSRSRDTGGAGLGLAIVSGLVAAHGGSVEFGDADALLGGARVRVTLPLFQPEGIDTAEEDSA